MGDIGEGDTVVYFMRCETGSSGLAVRNCERGTGQVVVRKRVVWSVFTSIASASMATR